MKKYEAALLNERHRTHGPFENNAEISQEIKRIFRSHWHDDLSDVQREALDQIAFKLSRILSGKSKFRDHWRDVSGYALLGMEDCDEG